jgi:hypothetical protein
MTYYSFFLFLEHVSDLFGFPMNVAFEWVAILHVREVLGSNLGLVTRYPNLGASSFSSVSPCKRGAEIAQSV